jgi:hypothetical protein
MPGTVWAEWSREDDAPARALDAYAPPGWIADVINGLDADKDAITVRGQLGVLAHQPYVYDSLTRAREPAVLCPDVRGAAPGYAHRRSAEPGGTRRPGGRSRWDVLAGNAAADRAGTEQYCTGRRFCCWMSQIPDWIRRACGCWSRSSPTTVGRRGGRDDHARPAFRTSYGGASTDDGSRATGDRSAGARDRSGDG